MAEEEYQSVVSNEFRRLADYLLETPRASKEEVQKYHCSLKKKIDSGEIIPVPSHPHRTLHEIMWIKGHEIYNLFNKFSEAIAHFCKIEASQECKDIKSEHDRFDIWYAKTYVPKDIDDNWARAVREVAEKEAGKPLEEICLCLD